MNGNKINDFLVANGLILNDDQLDRLGEAFARDMEAGLAGSTDSLMMLPTYITADGTAPQGERVIVIDAGGTNLRVALCYTDKDGKTVIESFEKTRMPGSDHPIDVEEFFDAVAGKLLPIIDKSDKIGVCFSYAAEVLPCKDARIIAMNKEVVLNNSKGVLVCDGIARALKRLGVEGEKHFVLINDTVAALLGAKADNSGACHDGYIGFILGTGTNIAYSEPCKNIKKVPELASSGGSMIINIESGYFNKPPRSHIDRAIDAESKTPGLSIGEKMISGAYIGEIIRRAFLLAAKEGVMSAPQELAELPLWDVDKFLRGEPSLLDSIIPESDREAATAIITAVFDRAAAIVAAEFAGIMLRNDVGRSRPVCVCTEGTTVNKSPIFKSLIIEHVNKQVTEKYGASMDFVFVEDATLKGTALAAALNC